MNVNPLHGFCAASLAVHAVLLGVSPGPVPNAGDGRDSRILEVTLARAPGPEEPRLAAIRRPVRSAATPSRERPAICVRCTAVPAPGEPMPAAQNPPVSAPPGFATDSVARSNEEAPSDALALRLQRLAADRLSRHFTYPALARQRGWSGTVVLAFVVDADGRLNDIDIAQSSGFALLDRSAADDLRRLGRLDAAVPWLQGDAVAVTLPVEYRLLEN